jgi:protoheme IX farnesyltransferase
MSETTQTLESEESQVSDFFELLKPKVMSLVIFTGLAGMWAAPGFGEMHPFMAIVAMFCLALGAGAAGAINMWYDRDIDAIMNRTKERPIPTGHVHSSEALAFGLILSLASVAIMGLALNWVAAGILAFANLFYVVIYTMWLKRSTPQNIVIGGAAGAVPPMIGWAAVTGDITLYPVILFAIIFFWTPPHFWALSLFANEDYKRAKIPMLTVTHGARHTKIQMMVYSLILLPLAISPYFLGFASMTYGIVAVVLGGLFVLSNIRVLMHDDLKHAKVMFGYSIFYLFALFLMVIIDAT